MLLAWCIWKERNRRTFNNGPANTFHQLFVIIVNDGQLWVQAGAKWLVALGWPESSPRLA
ncbi:hypothetical protein HU200_061935 [Digitaria exilis]|uniref:Uncharacterized protein n=1 Tax=Digitaria exilis TaxID=1010633 RepID=A0A835A7K2_9POAL|nr:hypothetical protein HU200_061935 [Digitaria exilis]